MNMYDYTLPLIMFYFVRITHTDLNAARDWLLEMGRGATVSGVDLLYCMALPREILQSVEIEAVKTARVSGDYLLSKVCITLNVNVYISSKILSTGSFI